jgi:plastocyanin
MHSSMKKLISSLPIAAVVLAVAAPALAANKTVKVADDVFRARTVTINKGNTVTWKWVGDHPHNVKFKTFKSKVQVNGTFRHRFTRRGTFRYVCTIHTDMKGKVIVQ